MLANLLSEIKVSLDQLLLDPNNPRFSELGEDLITIPEGRYAEEKIQNNTYEKMKADGFDVSELKDTIKQNGFLPMDRIVLRKWKNSKPEKEMFVVVEGNRRVTSLKWLMSLNDDGKETFDEEQINNFTKLPALLLDDNVDHSDAVLILPGLRHVSGVKEWGPYQKAKAVYALRVKGMQPQEAAQSLGLSTRAANKFYKCFQALEQMKANEEYGEYAHPKLFSYFEETFKVSSVSNWLNWSEQDGLFINKQRLSDFYSWIIPDPESDGEQKLPEAKSLRSLAKIIDDEHAMAIFCAPGGTLTNALVKYQSDHPEEWYPKILEALSSIKALTPAMLREMTIVELNALTTIQGLIDRQLKDRETLIKSGD